MDLYTTYANQFSATRNAPWYGWEKIIQFLPANQPIKILDLGCGNGRFFDWLIKKNINVAKYIGVDNSKQLLEIAKARFKTNSKAQFKNLDLNANWTVDEGDFTLIVAFGVMHHLENQSKRVYLYQNALELLKSDGLLVLTFWQFVRKSAYTKKIIKSLPNNDFVLSFGNENAKRFCHYSSDEEILSLEKSANVKPFLSYLDDGRDSSENLYKIYKK